MSSVYLNNVNCIVGCPLAYLYFIIVNVGSVVSGLALSPIGNASKLLKQNSKNECFTDSSTDNSAHPLSSVNQT